MAEFVSNYVVLPSEHTLVAVVLWVAHTHGLDYFDSTPRLAFLSPEPGSGKSRAQEVLESLCPAPLRTSTVTSPVLFRLIGSDARPTVFMDEVDTIWTGRGVAEELRAVVNAGHRRGNGAHRMVGEGVNMQARTFATFAPVCLAGLGDLPATIADRSVVINMKRRRADEPIRRWTFRTCEPLGHVLRDRLALWVTSLNALPMPEPVDDIADRAFDVWEPLLAIADAAGGEWPSWSRAACRALTQDKACRPTSGVRLLTDLRAVWPSSLTFAPSAYLVDRLVGLADSPWGHDPQLSAKRLATLLRRYGVTPQQSPDRLQRGYFRDQLVDPWERYTLAPTRPDPDTSDTSGHFWREGASHDGG